MTARLRGAQFSFSWFALVWAESLLTQNGGVDVSKSTIHITPANKISAKTALSIPQSPFRKCPRYADCNCIADSQASNTSTISDISQSRLVTLAAIAGVTRSVLPICTTAVSFPEPVKLRPGKGAHYQIAAEPRVLPSLR